MIITTTNAVDGKRIIAYKGIVFGEVISGVNFIKDFTAGLSDLFGGRSKTYESELIDARINALRELEERAYSLGANPITMARRVLWPLALPGIAAGAIFCFILTMNAYATPVLLGGPQFVMMSPLVYVQFAGKSNWPFGASVSFILMAATLILTTIANLLVQRRYRA